MKKDILHSAVGYLARREHTEKELTQKLLNKEFLLEDIQVVITHLLEKNYLSNERYTECAIRNRVSRGYGFRHIENELKQKGIDNGLFLSVMVEQEIDWYLQAELAYNKRFGDSPIKDQKDKVKRIRFLQYRGFSTDEIMTVLKTD